jgi:hypothetical protein
MTERVYLRTYDHLSEVPQPSGPVVLEVPDGATDDQIIEVIEREGDQARPFTIERRDGLVNPGWALAYVDGAGHPETLDDWLATRRARPSLSLVPPPAT